ncbi:MAG: hypothetical protein NTY98_12300, partial [Verrucomicrobia bacterium]|nr:hypothetical protein [Verrucomicrobiota bacterium]
AAAGRLQSWGLGLGLQPSATSCHPSPKRTATFLSHRPTSNAVPNTIDAEPDVAQKVYSGVVTARGYVDRFRYTITPHVDITGFSGAPIVDEKGLLVGVMTVWFQPQMEGELWTEAGGEDAQTALARIKAP